MTDFPVILGYGSLHSMGGPPDPGRPRLLGMKSVSPAAAWALQRKPPSVEQALAGFLRENPGLSWVRSPPRYPAPT
jgi:hypothetical protein